MERRHWLALGVGAILAVAIGWVALVSLSGPDSSYYLDAGLAEGNVSENETIEYETLTTEERQIFESAVASDSMVEIPDDVDEDVFIDNRYVRYQNHTYEVAVAVSD